MCKSVSRPFATDFAGRTCCCAPMVRLPLDEAVDFVYLCLTGEIQIISRSAAAMLLECDSFKTLDGHAVELCRRLGLGPGKHKIIESSLTSAVHKNCFVTWKEIEEECRRRNRTEYGSSHIQSIGWITRERLAQLHDSMQSYIKNAKQFGHSLTYIVLDDSESADACNATNRMCAMLQARHDVRILYAGKDEKMRYATKLVREVACPPEVIEFGLFDVEGLGNTIGANRNALLLQAAGESLLSVDDDTLAKTALVPNYDELSALIIGINDPTQFWFFHNRDEALSLTAFSELDVVGWHDTVLSLSLDTLISRLPANLAPSINGLCQHIIPDLIGGAGRIRISSNGLVGDSGLHSAEWLLSSKGPTRERLLASEETYRTAFSSREVMRVSTGVAICHNDACMSGMLGLAARDLLPPFPPVLRNEDGVFGTLLHKCFEHAYSAHLPIALVHAATSGRTYYADLVSSARCVRFSQIVRCLVNSTPLVPDRPAGENLQTVGRHLIQLGRLKPRDFEEQLNLQLWAQVGKAVAEFEGCLQAHAGSPEFWRRDIERTLTAWHSCLRNADYIVPADVLPSQERGVRLAATQRLLGGFGQLMHWWPTIFEAAVRLRCGGCSLAVPVVP
jgi:hypothetical protein